MTTIISRLLAKLDADTSGLERGLGQAESRMQRAAGVIAGVGKKLSVGVTLPLVGIATAATKTALDFDKAMFSVNSVVKAQGPAFQALKEEILDFSTKTSQSAGAVAMAYKGIVASGWEAQDSMTILKVAVDAAGNAMADTATTTRALTSVLSAFEMGAEDVTRVADVMLTAVNNSAMTFDELTSSVGTVVGAASAAKIPFESVAAGLMVMTKQGYTTAAATTSINAAITQILKPTEAFSELLAKAGYESGEAAIAALGFEGVIKLVGDATEGSAAAIGELFSNVRSSRAMMALAKSGSEQYTAALELLGKASEAEGEHARMSAIRHESAAYTLTKLKGTVEVISIRLGNVFLPIVEEVASAVLEWTTKLSQLDQGMIETIAKVGATIAVVGPLLLLFVKLVSAGQALASGISLVVTAVGILTGVATTLGAALMTIVPLAVIAGLALLAKKVYDNIEAHKQLAAEAIHTSSTYTEYRQAVEDSDRWTTTLSEDVWKLVDAKIELQNATGEAAAALAAEGIEQQKLLDAMQKVTEIQVGMPGHIAREVYQRGEAAKALILQDAELRKVALAMRLLTQAEFDLVEGIEASDRAMLAWAESTQELREQTGYYTEVVKESTKSSLDWIKAGGGVGGVMAEIAMETEKTTKTTVDLEKQSRATFAFMMSQYQQLSDKIRDERITTALEALGQAFQGLGDAIGSGYERMAAAADTYQSAMLASQSQYDQQMARMVDIGAQDRLFALEKHLLSQAQALAKYEAEAAALAAGGQDKRLEDLTRSFEESQARSLYAFRLAEAQREQSEAIQAHIAQVAQAQREYDAALSQYNELQELQKFIGNKIMMWIALHKGEIDMAGGSADEMLRTVGDMFGSQLSLADQFNIGWQSFMKDWADNNGDALKGVAEYWKGFHETMQGELDAGAATMAAAQSRLDSIGASWSPPVLQAPTLPDFSQWAQDYSSGVSGAGSQITESATKSMKQVVVDIAKAFETAMATFKKVAEYRPATGLAAGMEALRKDIQEAVRQLYIAYESIGKEGVTGAGLIAEAADKVFGAIGKAVDTFGKMADYAAPLRSSLDSLLADVRYVLVKVRTELLDLWGWGGERKDTVWGHMESWSEAVSGVVGLVAQAVKAFEGVNQYTGIMPGVAEGLATDIKAVVTALADAIGEGGGLDEFKVQWAGFAADLLSTIAGAIEDLETIADYGGGIGHLSISRDKVDGLVSELGRVAGLIGYALYWDRDRYGETAEAARAMELAWLELNAGLISALAGTLEDMATLAAFKGGLEVAQGAIEAVMSTLNDTAETIRDAIVIPADALDESGELIEDLKAQWLGMQAKLVSTLAGVIDDIETLATFGGDLTVSQAIVENLMAALNDTAETIRDAIVIPAGAFDEGGRLVDDLKLQWLELQAGLVSTVSGIIEDLQALAAYEGGVQVNTAAVGKLMGALGRAASAILLAIGDAGEEFTWATREADELKAAWLELNTSLVSTLAGIISDIEALASFEGVDEAAFKVGLDNLFDALYWFLDEFNRRAGLFAGVVSEEGAAIAELMGQTASALGDAVQPVVDVAEFAVTPAEAAAGIGLFFGALKIFLDEFKLQAADFAEKANKDTADLAKVIGDTVSGIGAAVEPLINILEYNPEVVNIEDQFEKFFWHLGRVLWWIEAEKDNWAISKAAQDLAAEVDEVMGHLKTAVDFLDEMATYGEDTTVSALTGFLAFLIDLENIVGAINNAKGIISEEALASAAQFAIDCNQVLTDIRAGMMALNSLADLPTETINLVEAGKNLVASLVDGLVEQARDEWFRATSAIAALITQVLRVIDVALPLLDAAGVSLGVAFIQGWIDGLNDNAGALYAAIAAIVSNAIAVANAAAGVASPSKKMWAGLTGALAAGAREAAGAMRGLMGGAMAPAYAYAAPGGGAAGNTYTYNYSYNEAEGVGANTRASLRQDFELLQLYERLRG